MHVAKPPQGPLAAAAAECCALQSDSDRFLGARHSDEKPVTAPFPEHEHNTVGEEMKEKGQVGGKSSLQTIKISTRKPHLQRQTSFDRRKTTIIL
jgi:hypothetical protein